MTHEAIISGLYNTGKPDSLRTVTSASLRLDFQGIQGNKYYGFTKPSDTRDRELLSDPKFPKGVEIRNWRQWSAVSNEDLEQIAVNLGITELHPFLLGANLALTGIENFSKLPKGTRIHFPDEAILLVEEENLPCTGPGEEIAKYFAQVKPNAFVKAAYGLRGLVGVVYRPGIVRIRDIVKIEVYKPIGYSIPASK